MQLYLGMSTPTEVVMLLCQIVDHSKEMGTNHRLLSLLIYLKLFQPECRSG